MTTYISFINLSYFCLANDKPQNPLTGHLDYYPAANTLTMFKKLIFPKLE